MGLLSNRVERSEIKPGDHIYTWRAAYTYSHHGIYVGGSKVVHFTRKKEAGTAGLDSAIAISSLAISSNSEECPTFPDCGFQLPDSGVILTCLDCFLRDGALHAFEYGVAPAAFLAKLRGGTCTTAAAADPPESVVRRAMFLLQNGFGDYDVFENNCEDFAIYCKTGLLPFSGDGGGGDEMGIGRSGQAATAIGVPLAALLSTPFKLLAAGPIGMAAVTAGMYCAGRYITDIGVRKDVVKVEVENLSAHLGWCRAKKKAEEEKAMKKEQNLHEKVVKKKKSLLPLKRKRDYTYCEITC
uniref:LRAT domain-containing protein n=1 Tax=Leersia perrieri TaxID=77586 RepID=A0A0D9XAH5_9ORYZ